MYVFMRGSGFRGLDYIISAWSHIIKRWSHNRSIRFQNSRLDLVQSNPSLYTLSEAARNTTIKCQQWSPDTSSRHGNKRKEALASFHINRTSAQSIHLDMLVYQMLIVNQSLFDTAYSNHLPTSLEAQHISPAK